MHGHQSRGCHHLTLSAFDVEVVPHQETLGASHIVDLETDMMAQAMREEGSDSARLLDLFKATFQETQFAQALESHVAGMKLKLVVDLSRSDACYTLLLHALHNRIDRSGFLGETSVNGKGASDIAGVALVFAASVDNYQLLPLKGLVIGSIVEDRSVNAGASNDRIRLGMRTA
ncbi:hypothetical protein HG530_005920 [Fusarium avenaceum]|nr:hypothetical protein HG530_005920 [Fusarium avenaceum]